MISLGFCNSITEKIIKYNVDRLIDVYCAKYSDRKIKIEKALVKAIIQQESRHKPYCVRFEPGLYASAHWRSKVPAKYRDLKRAYSSAGLMQVLYTTARQMGFRGHPDDLLVESNSIEYGVK